ncbi:RdRP-domain-containing protein [Coniophora puteana RWD-64-598 SS2]|uniref:RNA-dependent RNA polymerase n=1 Tax=Coniophora puteana (strain RWD-64-598) TaxID=741705 RepID=A0A5M3N657_CONPW|nr:RdRP-domain-containing protein [Coniophora puteana RWD-64-598 SS2]EIW86345.1 RdRP-domain-containing protein [Coniophora puteana RWD-64-598 SS2]
MDIFMFNIAWAATAMDIKIEFANILHKHPYPTTPRLHFHVDLWTGNRRGKGILTIPYKEYGQKFLAAYGLSGIILKGRPIRFRESNRPLSEPRVNMLRDNPWQDPRELQKERDRIAVDSSSINIKTFSFGRFCRDGSFSAEVTFDGRVDLVCDFARKEVRLTITPGTSRQQGEETDDIFGRSIRDLATQLFGSQTFIASYKPSNIESLVTEDTSSSRRIFLKARASPLFYLQQASGSLAGTQQAQRLSSLTGNSDMPPGCHSLCVVFVNASDEEAFLLRCRRLGLEEDRRQTTIDVRNNLWSTDVMDELDQFLAELRFSVAWEVQKAVSTSVLSPREVMSIRRDITLLDREAGEHAPRIFLRFSGLIEETHLQELRRPRPRRRRRKQKQSPHFSTSDPSFLSNALIEAVKAVKEELLAPRGLLTSPLARDGAYEAYHLIFTPSTYILDGPLPDQSNSVLRRFGNHECFLRVSFQDENRAPLRRDFEYSISELMQKRFRPIFLGGHKVAGRHYEFLGYSMSGLREHSVWFVTPFTSDKGITMDAETIRGQLGDFSELQYKPARLGARWSQAFSTTDPSVTLERREIQYVNDITSASGNCMTDGCSSISIELAREIWTSLNRTRRRTFPLKFPPSAFQFRLGGAKGVVVQNPDLNDRVVCLRKSQRKFEAPNVLTFDVQSHTARPRPMFLNRPLIAILEHLGEQDTMDRILELQHADIQEAQGVRSSFRDAAKMLQVHGLGASFHLTSLFGNLAKELNMRVWTRESDDGWQNEVVIDALRCISTHALRELKYRAHIRVPGSYTLMGVSDEWNCLRPGEIFATVRDIRNGLDKPIVGRVAVTRSPQIHPGDIQVVTAVRRPELEHLTNVVVFSTQGDRALPSFLGGGDLDGDDFNLILDEALFPTANSEPGSYVSLPIKETTHPCGIEDVVDFVFNYFETDLVGRIAIMHLRFADLEDPGCASCMTLAELAAQAVDFPKTGTPVDFKLLPRLPDKEIKPDFLAREGENPHKNERFYESQKLLGELFRRVPLQDWSPGFWNKEESPFDVNTVYAAIRRARPWTLGLPILGKPSPVLWEEMMGLCEAYCDQLYAIAQTHTVSRDKDDYISEAELVSGTIIANWSDHRKRREAVNAMNLQVLVRQVRQELRPQRHEPDVEDSEYDTFDWDDEDEDDVAVAAETFTRAWAALLVAASVLRDDPTTFGPQSFGLIALGRMLEIMKNAQQDL